MRSTTAPAVLPSLHVRPFLPSRTTNTLAFGAVKKQSGNSQKTAADKRHCEMELYLMQNTIRRLPRELFALDRLVVLSLRALILGFSLFTPLNDHFNISRTK